MWKPNEVLPEHKWRARVVWVGLLLSILAYTAWEIVIIAFKRKKPSTSLTITDELYQFPYVLVCVFDGQGCDAGTSECISSAREYATGYSGNDEHPEVVVDSQWSNCIGFDFTVLDVDGVNITEISFVQLGMVWLVTNDTLTEGSYTQSVGVYFGEPDPEEASLPFAEVPYSRDSAELIISDVAIGKITRDFLDGGTVTTFPILTLSTAAYKSAPVETTSSSSSGTTSAVGSLIIKMTQGPYSRSIVTDIDPLELGTLLGNIGGFWELLIIVWGLCFIAVRHDRSRTLKGRNFAKSIQIGTEVVTRRRSLSSSASVVSEATEDRPHWEPAFRSNGANARTNAGPTGGSASHTLNSRGSTGVHQPHVTGVRQSRFSRSFRSQRLVESNLPRRIEGASPSSTAGSNHRAAPPTRSNQREMEPVLHAECTVAT